MIRITIEKLTIEFDDPQEIPKQPDTPTQMTVEVMDSFINQENPFWKVRIGSIGKVISERGGMWEVQFPDEVFPCQDVLPERFKILPA